MIYLGDNWPDKYRDSIFIGNIHGYRVNNNVLERKGSGYVGNRAPDFFFANDNWFRALELKYGPDGGVYLTDWCDTGECHDYKGVHRTSGRVYKIIYGDAKPAKQIDLSKLSNKELIELQLHKNDYFGRNARCILQARKNLKEDEIQQLQAMLKDHADITRRLRALWCLHVTEELDVAALTTLLGDKDENLRGWAIRLLREYDNGLEAQADELQRMAENDKSALVRLEIASAMQRMPHALRWSMAEALVAHAEDAEDDNLPLMIYYGIEPAIPTDKARAAKLLAATKMPTVRQHIARRMTATASKEK